LEPEAKTLRDRLQISAATEEQEKKRRRRVRRLTSEDRKTDLRERGRRLAAPRWQSRSWKEKIEQQNEVANVLARADWQRKTEPALLARHEKSMRETRKTSCARPPLFDGNSNKISTQI
jgi:hypothetical protein